MASTTQLEKSESADETATRSEGTKHSLVLSSRVLVQRACNHSAVEVYRYDVDGKLTGAETDITSWEERNTEIYGWLNSDTPPFEPRQPVNRFRSGGNLPRSNDPTSIKDYEALMDEMAVKVSTVPANKSTEVFTEQTVQTKPDEGKDLSTSSKATTVKESRRSHSEHSISYKSTIEPSNVVPTAETAAKPSLAHNRGQVSKPTSSSSQNSADRSCTSKKLPGFKKPSPVDSRSERTDFGTVFGAGSRQQSTSTTASTTTSTAERHRKRCDENRVRKASNKPGQNQIAQQQQQQRQQRYSKNY